MPGIEAVFGDGFDLFGDIVPRGTEAEHRFHPLADAGDGVFRAGAFVIVFRSPGDVPVKGVAQVGGCVVPPDDFARGAGGGHFREPDGLRASDLLVQAKALLRPLKTNDWGASMSAGHVRHRAVAGGAAASDYYVNLPLSLSLRDDQLTAHANIGWLREGASGANRPTWGLAAETQLHPRVGLVTEAFGQLSRDSFYQLGLRFWVVPERVQIDTTYGNRIGRGDQARWFSIGLRLLSPAFLP